MRNTSLWRAALGLERVVIEAVHFDEDARELVVSVRPRKGAAKPRCGRCGRRCPRYDRGQGRRRWRALDLGTVRAYLEAEAPRVSCPDHGVVGAQVPWARHGAGHTRDFDDQVAWLAVQCSKTAITQLMGVAWRTVGAILSRVEAELGARVDRLEGLARIGIDEVSYKRGHRYLTVVVDHDSGHLVWASPGRDEATLQTFFAALGPDRCTRITHVSADAADWIAKAVEAACPNAVRCGDPFHVVAWATEALDLVRRQAWNEARGGRPQVPATRQRQNWSPRAQRLRRVRWALWKNPERLTQHQRHQLEWVADNHPRVWRAYRLKEGLRYVFAVKGAEGKEALDCWLTWASHSQLEPFVHVARRIRAHRAEIDATLDHGLSNGLIESTNTKIRLLTRIAFGFQGPGPLIALAMLALGGNRPHLPGRHRSGVRP